jgi:hypothetical protein
VEVVTRENYRPEKTRLYDSNDNAGKLSDYYTHYNKLTTINSVDGALYNSAGKEMKHFRKKDMSDYAREGEAFVSDDRMKVSGFTYNAYPYSVTFEEEDEKAGAFIFQLGASTY